MMSRCLVIALLWFTMAIHGQAPVLWDSLCGIPSNSIDGLLGVDSANSLFVTGDFTNIGTLNSWGIAKWNNGWDSIPGGIGNSQFSNMPNTMKIHSDMIWYKNKLYIGDCETWHNKEKTGPLGVWNGTQWQNLPGAPFLNRTSNPNFDRSIMSFKNVDDTLYIGGVFDSVGTQKIDCIVKFDGVNFHTLNFTNPVLGNRVTCIEKYKGEIYIAGNLLDEANNPNKTMWRIFRKNASGWYNVGNGVRGGNAQVNAMAIYKGYLYVAGWFVKSDGNAGNHIMKWDGNNWHPVPGGLEGTDGEVRKLLVHNDKLYVFGSFSNAGDIPASRMAVYDGKQWCDLGGTTYGYVKAATFYKDTLYVGGTFGYVGDRYIWYVAKRLAGDYHDTCGAIINTDTVSVNEYQKLTDVKIYPNPSAGVLNISFTTSRDVASYDIKITDVLGREVLRTEFKPQINISDLVKGIYFISIEKDGQALVKRKFIKE